jgi:hypothetical protein
MEQQKIALNTLANSQIMLSEEPYYPDLTKRWIDRGPPHVYVFAGENSFTEAELAVSRGRSSCSR